MPDLRQLRAFVAVAEERNFTRAAERLHLAQQAVSKTIRSLERELGVELLARTTREVNLTPAGEALLRDAPNVLAAADAAFARAREAGHGLSGTVRIGASPALGTDELARIVSALRTGAPQLSVSVLEARPGQVARLLRERTVDIVVARTLRTAPEVDSTALPPTPAVLVLPREHPLAGTDPLPLAALDGQRLLTMSRPGTPYTDLVLNRLAAAGARVEPVESPVVGAPALMELPRLRAIAVMPEGTPPVEGVVVARPQEPVTLPLLVAWLAGPPPAAVARLRTALGATR